MDSYTIKDLLSDLEHFQKVMTEACASLSRPEERQRVQELLGQFQQARAEAEKEIPPILEANLKSAQAAEAECEALIKEIEQAQQQVEEQLKAPMAPPTRPPLPPEFTIEPTLGETLRQEVLDRYIGQPKPEEPKPGSHDLWHEMRGPK